MPRTSLITGDIFVASDGPRSLDAWLPLDHCVGCLHLFQNSDTEPRWNGWLNHWIAGVSLLRTVGHVLQNVDSKKSREHHKMIRSHWSSWQSNKDESWIFWEFIQQDRNNILKEFNFGFQTYPYEEPGDYEVEPEVDQKMQLFREAVYWWRHQLRMMEHEALSFEFYGHRHSV